MKNKNIRFSLMLTLIILMTLLSGCGATTSESITTTDSTDIQIIASETTTETTNVDDVNALHLEALSNSVSSWGLGQTIISYVGNNRDYEWYIDQAHTGLHSEANCGPSSVAMAALWADKNTSATPEAARKAYRSSGGWWYSDDINNALDMFNTDYDVVELNDLYDLRAIIDSGAIVIVNNSMGYIPKISDVSEHVNRFYDFDSGHYFIVKGYLLVDDQTYFEVYDPNNWDEVYEDGTQKGKDRYYEATVLMDSITNWYPYGVVIKSTKE